MLRYKVLVIQRGKAFIAIPNDVKEKIVILGSSKKEVLKKSQLIILDEVKERKELFAPDYKANIESIVREKNVKTEDGDIELQYIWDNKYKKKNTLC